MKISELNKLTKELFEKREETADVQARLTIRNQIVELNIRLVPHMLKKYRPYTDDTYQWGCIGLLKAADAYTLSKGVPFANYACLVIEKEIQLAHKYSQRTFETRMADFLTSLDELSSFGEDEGHAVHELVADDKAQQDFDKLFWENNLDDLFTEVIIPCIYAYGKRSNSIDLEAWKDLEIKYFLEMAEVKSQRQRLTFTEMAKQLHTVPQNIRGRHKQVVELVKRECKERGIA